MSKAHLLNDILRVSLEDAAAENLEELEEELEEEGEESGTEVEETDDTEESDDTDGEEGESDVTDPPAEGEVGTADNDTLQIDPPEGTKRGTEDPDADAVDVPDTNKGKAAAEGANDGKTELGVGDAHQDEVAELPEEGAGDERTELEGFVEEEGQLNIVPAETERLLNDSIKESEEMQQETVQLMDVEGKVEQLEELADTIDEKAEAGELDEASLEAYGFAVRVLLSDLRLDGAAEISMEDGAVPSKGIRVVIEKIKGFVADRKKSLADRGTKWKANVLTNAVQVKKRAQLAQRDLGKDNLESVDKEVVVNAKKLYTEGQSLSDPLKIAQAYLSAAKEIGSLLHDRLPGEYQSARKLWDGVDYGSNAKVDSTLKGAKAAVPLFDAVDSKLKLSTTFGKVGLVFDEPYFKAVEVSGDATAEAAHVVAARNAIRMMEDSPALKKFSDPKSAPAMSLDQARKAVDLAEQICELISKHDTGIQTRYGLVPGEVADQAPGQGFLSSLSEDNQKAIDGLFHTLAAIEEVTYWAQCDVAIRAAVAANELVAWAEKSVRTKKG